MVSLIVALLFLVFFAAFDLQYRRVPNSGLVLMLAVRVVLFVFELTGFLFFRALPGLLFHPLSFPWRFFGADFFSRLGSQLLAFFLVLLFAFLIRLVSPRSLGAGDVKLLAVLSLYFGCELMLPTVLVGFVTAGGVSLILLLRGSRQRQRLSQKLPLVPFFLIGALFSIGVFL